MIKKMKFENKIILSAIIITFIPLTISYSIFLQDKLEFIDQSAKVNIKQAAFSVSHSTLVQEKLYKRENDYSIQNFTKSFINNDNNTDIIVVADMNGIKYSHLDESQIKEVFVNEDKRRVLETGEGYYSRMVGSMGDTLRWFEPVYYNGKQVGFVMVGKFYDKIELVNKRTKGKYILLFMMSFSIAIVISKFFAMKVKKAILGMEPEEIANLYNQKKAIINSVKEGIIALNKEDEVTEISVNCYELFPDFSVEKIKQKLSSYIKERKHFEMKEFIIQGEKIFVTMQPLIINNKYLGMVITFIAKEDINKIAKEITGVDEMVKNLRANVHEFKNNLHVILGLLHIKEYDEARSYIQQIQQIQEMNTIKFSNIEDSYVRALLLSRELVAKERNIELVLTEESFLYKEHNYVDSYDLVTILGNLIENAFEACTIKESKNKKVEITLFEDNTLIEIQVRDNGKEIEEEIKKSIFDIGISSKGSNRGTGLHLVKSRVELYDGNIEIEEFEEEKIFVITIFKGVENI
ncbi:two-component system, CitB family, sensor kinase [Clostridium cavendishii DSM 21758]|uniref:Two-component system, CitB family, sensor kinase n=1 Tax=Clostridium cavendishii DSM 21758 TaxID=1121302 RepID=A0A1M6RWC4_9CLOT|nr:ATP-binding protein [Clostridium cavendishii]SHK36786.1 two-component system, CitB family, sensor kinase [Clostridium cavendishii DSM 21758]